jgi:hypothetical protein
MVRSYLLVVLLLACLAAPVHARSRQSPMDKATAKAAEATPEKESEAAGSQTEAAATESTTAMPAAPGSVVLSDPVTRQKYLTAMQRYYEYRADGYAYRSRVFEWQLLSSRAIFIVVLLMVAAGMYFAAVQFQTAMVAARRVAAAEAIAGAPPAGEPAGLATRFEITAKGLVVNSSVLGVIILTLSIAFFYLYLVYVYPIQNVF